MARKPMTVGRGITEREVTVATGVDRKPALRSAFEDWAHLRANAGGTFAAVTAPMMSEVREVLSGAGAAPHDQDSPEDYAARIRNLQSAAAAEIQRGNADDAARFAFQAGYLYCEATMKERWEPEALRGAATIQAARDGHASVHGTEAQKLARWRSMAADFFALVDRGTPVMRASKEVGVKHGWDAATVRRAAKKIGRV
ncbi:MAG: hypothetical protein ABJP67_14510 [Nitratireductor sp.]|uniref:hypothetical protein n=1 Tax=Bauldia litoralis TaxID=665467 RepID=UPI003266D9F5